MRKSSWILLGICAALFLCLGLGYLFSRSQPVTLNEHQVTQMLDKMKEAVAHKEVGTLMAQIASDSETRIAGMKPDQLRLMLARGFRSTGKLTPTYSDVQLTTNGEEATVNFNLKVENQEGEVTSDIYSGHITLKLKRLEVPRLLGLFHAQEWKVVGAEQNGRDFNSFGEY